MTEQNEHPVTDHLSTFITKGMNGWQAGFTIGVQTFYLQPVGCEVGDERDTEERAKWYQGCLETAFKNINAQSPSGANILVEALEKIVVGYDKDSSRPGVHIDYSGAKEIAHSALAQYKSQPGSLQGEQEKDYKTALEETRESLSELIRSMGRIENGSPMKDFDKERLKKAKVTLAKYWEGGGPMIVQSQSPEHKSDRESEGIDEAYIRKFLIDNRVIRAELQDECTQLLLLFYNHITRK